MSRDVVIGLDLATRSGWAVLGLDGSYVASGSWACSPRARRAKADRWVRFASALTELLAGLEDRVAVVAIERPIGRHNGGAVPAVAWGLVALAELAAERRGIPSVRYPPPRVKRAATGSGSASKTAVAEAMASRYGVELKAGDEADALAVATTALARLDLEALACGELVERSAA